MGTWVWTHWYENMVWVHWYENINLGMELQLNGLACANENKDSFHNYHLEIFNKVIIAN